MNDSIKKINYLFICLFIFLNPLIPYNVKIHNNITVSDILLLVIFVLFLVEILRNRQKLKECFYIMLGDKTLFCLILLFIVMMISVTYAKEKPLALEESLRFFCYIGLYIILSLSYREEKHFKGFVTSFVASVTLISIIGIFQKITGMGIPHQYDYKVNGVTMVRVAAVFGNPNTLAAFMILSIFPIVMFAFFEKNLKKKAFYSILSVLIVYNAALTGSRNSYMGLALGFCVLALIYSIKLILPIIVLGGASMFLPQVTSRLRSIDNKNLNDARIKLWKTALKMIKDHPLSGVGNGNYIANYDAYVKQYPELRYADYSRFPVHNSYLKIESELGIFGGIFFVATIVNVFLKLYNTYKKTDIKIKKAFYLGFIASTSAFLFMNFSDNLLFVPSITSFFWMFVAIGDRH
ncbi:O-antigen ligase [Clostridium acetobutylicum]|uniref:Membrane protein of EXOQ family, involved in exopolysaccharide production n=1 Tax=Clostridium acetobutylicum (strain ATCC 824 / DSM 792 / JCM 1419 / IAM 19013 / LMG 5710 / NBRC 13948 / NRRL B-527 / VKM B-1787 / 2291 / W) TaxID=272562 RepID=Q97GP8_CLOAB|nr:MULTISPECIES: O-antigen ligase [Clostridium]AAK80274.1 Membrane protein of EXOQ family, involved in exopolysaccharide production [Clostridium acetobutylicum ATCC 824]ADZ21370.1 Membrane protein of EXOQ family [Clostridium acetobutylicum EA 2018]AEI32275.1 ExoQ family exopolysaccharide biosynthesis membrane protein [Clostridium acetobutylicum DSM 1731]AWV79303.1 O-antigen ligase family protein [Clostridium acetobutylicum]MBC2394727.1 O-antigen ligase family protein [Clostridium acetobutylicu